MEALENIKQNELNQVKSKCEFNNLKSNYILQKIFNNLKEKKSLEMIKYNNKIKNRININSSNYKEYCEAYSSIEIELIPFKDKSGKFINIKDEDNIYYHIYFNDNKEEIKRNYLNKDDKVTKINIIIDYQIISFENLFYFCDCIESIIFNKFYRKNIINMNGMFSWCSFLKEIKLSNFNTTNVTTMSQMFNGCLSLIEINLSNFNTNNVTNMCFMFSGCESLKEINFSNFNTNNVTDMGYMFSECSEELKMKGKTQIKNINEEAFK